MVFTDMAVELILGPRQCNSHQCKRLSTTYRGSCRSKINCLRKCKKEKALCGTCDGILHSKCYCFDCVFINPPPPTPNTNTTHLNFY